MASAGRPKFEITEQMLLEVEALAANGLSQKQIAAYWGVNEKTIIARKRDHQQFSEYLERGRAKGTAKMGSALFKSGLDGKVDAQKFYLMHVAGWRDKQDHVIEQEQKAPLTVIFKKDES